MYSCVCVCVYSDGHHLCVCTVYRTTILPMEKDLEDMLDKFADFHNGFLAKYGKQ